MVPSLGCVSMWSQVNISYPSGWKNEPRLCDQQARMLATLLQWHDKVGEGGVLLLCIISFPSQVHINTHFITPNKSISHIQLWTGPSCELLVQSAILINQIRMYIITITWLMLIVRSFQIIKVLLANQWMLHLPWQMSQEKDLNCLSYVNTLIHLLIHSSLLEPHLNLKHL